MNVVVVPLVRMSCFDVVQDRNTIFVISIKLLFSYYTLFVCELFFFCVVFHLRNRFCRIPFINALWLFEDVNHERISTIFINWHFRHCIDIFLYKTMAFTDIYIDHNASQAPKYSVSFNCTTTLLWCWSSFVLCYSDW